MKKNITYIQLERKTSIKKNICGIFCVLIISLLFSGCKGNVDDLNKQVEKMEKIIIEDKIFTNDYVIEGIRQVNDETLNYLFVVDGNNYYIEVNADEGKTKYWFIKNHEMYNVYIDDGDKYYNYLDISDLKDVIVKIFSSYNVNFNFGIKETYINVSNNLKTFIDKCNEKEYTCEFDKKIFSEIIFHSSVEVSDNISSEVSYTIKKGKIMKTFSKTSTLSDEIIKENSYTYSNQNIDIPNEEDYIFQENLFY